MSRSLKPQGAPYTSSGLADFLKGPGRVSYALSVVLFDGPITLHLHYWQPPPPYLLLQRPFTSQDELANINARKKICN